MLRTILTVTLSIGVLLSCGGPDRQHELDAELSAILEALPGVYKSEAPKAVPPTGEIKSLYFKFSRIDAPQFGDAVLYHQLSTDSGNGPASQMKIFSFSLDPERKANRMRAFVFAPGQAPANLEQDPDRLAALDPSTLMTFPAECDLIWTSAGESFFGEVQPNDCAFAGEVFKQTIRPAMSYRVEGDQFEWAETLYTGDMKVLVSTEGALPAVRQ